LERARAQAHPPMPPPEISMGFVVIFGQLLAISC